jgi:hypothetical protein
MNNLLKDYGHSEFFKIDKLDKETTSSPTKPNPKAIYISRPMCFNDLPEPRNSTKVQIENPEGNYNFINLIVYRHFTFH